MLLNNLDPDVAERREASSSTARLRQGRAQSGCLEAILRELERLGEDETLLVQSGKPVADLPHARRCPPPSDRELEPRPEVGDVGRVPAPRGARADDIRPDDGRLLDLHRDAKSCRAYETFAEAGRRDLGSPDGSLAGKLAVTAGLGGMGGAQPLAVTMGGGTALVAEVDAHRIDRRLETRYCDERIDDLDARDRPRARGARREGGSRSASWRTPSTSSRGSSSAGSCRTS